MERIARVVYIDSRKPVKGTIYHKVTSEKANSQLAQTIIADQKRKKAARMAVAERIQALENPPF